VHSDIQKSRKRKHRMKVTINYWNRGLVLLGLLAHTVVSVCAAGEVYRDPKASVEVRTEDLLQRMTPEEKLDYIGGTDFWFMRSLPRLGLPLIRSASGPVGVFDGRFQSTAHPASICVAATWNPDLAWQSGVAMGRDCRARGVHILLGGGVNIYRNPQCGRNFEYMGEDPFLAGVIASSQILGVQSQGVLATIKHFACNNQGTQRDRGDSVVDERTLREIYLPAFKAAVQVGKVGCVMDAYNKVNGVQCTENSFLNTQILRKEWGFNGIVMSDW
jgi:beta-glucosidase